MNKTGNKQAFPAGVNDTSGLTKREYFAGLAMQAHLTGVINVGGNNSYDDVASSAVKYADALLAELEKTQP